MDNTTEDRSVTSLSAVGSRGRDVMLLTPTIAVSVATIAIHCMLLPVLVKTKRVPLSIKFLAFNLLVCNIIVFGVFVTTSVLYMVVEEKYMDVVFYTRILAVSCPYAVSWSTTVGFAIERLITLTNPYHLERWLRKRNCIMFLVMIWVLNCVLPASVYILKVSQACNWTIVHTCLSEAFVLHRVYFTVIFSANTIVILASFGKVTLVVRDHIRRIHVTTFAFGRMKRHPFQLTRVIFALVLVYSVVHTPLLVFSAVFLVKPEWQVPDKQILFQSLTFFSVILNAYISMYMYFWKIPECRLNILMMYCARSETRRAQIQDLRLEVYNIVTIRDS